MTVRTRLIVTFALVGGLLIFPALFAADRLAELRDLAVQERGRQADASLAVGRIEAGLVELDRNLRSYLVTASPEARLQTASAVAQLRREASQVRRAGYEEAVEPLEESLRKVEGEVLRIGRVVDADGVVAATERVPDFEGAVRGARDRLLDAAETIATRAEADFERARTISVSARQTTVVALAVAVALTALLAAWTTGALTIPLRRLSAAVARVAEGNFEAPDGLPYDRPDEIGELADSFRIMTENLAELDRIKAEFMGVASHELRTPINVIRGYAELIEEGIAGDLTPRQREIMERIGEQTGVLARQVNRLMDISRIETGSYEISPESVRVEDLVQGLRRTYEILADEKGVALVTEVAGDSPERVVVDVDLIREEVLGNLVSNALKFTPEGGRVEVRAFGSDGELVIDVTDSGPGVPPEQREQVFEKYYRGEGSRSAGSGLGLAIARETVEAHSGSIALVDGEGPGATFRVRIPLT